MYIFKLAFRNLLGAGLRTWLNTFILSISFVIIIAAQGLYQGMSDQMKRTSIDGWYGGGQYWQATYDPYDPLTLDDAHGVLPDALRELTRSGQAAPVLFRQATLYPKGRVVNITLKGIPPEQTILQLPSAVLQQNSSGIPALIGDDMSRSSGLKEGDTVMLRWRDAHGAFDAVEITIAGVMRTDTAEIDAGQVWIALDSMQRLMDLPDESTIVILAQGLNYAENFDGWNFQSQYDLLADLRGMMFSQYMEGGVMYAVFLFMAMLGIFDTQILALFRRRKEMGTMLALGITKSGLIRLFTLEGALHSVLAGALAAVYGTPFLLWFNKVGYAMPDAYSELGMSMGNVLYPTFTPGLIGGTSLLIFTLTAIVSYLPARRISKLTPTEALRGKME
ncbi:MAG: FtsX-like permease family protein [Candidatus Margulisbacteria bacterium]|jgi:ABC-type lipoprotein release transport system permease subunit|nr:FtsX-like permease family protein [Candidatus Margulisiibacteriota bacterium]